MSKKKRIAVIAGSSAVQALALAFKGQPVKLQAVAPKDGFSDIYEKSADLFASGKAEVVPLEARSRVSPQAQKAIAGASLVILGPGEFYTGLIESLMVRGLAETIKESKAKKVFISNLMTKHSETHGFVAGDFVVALEDFLGQGVLDLIILNNRRPPEALLKRYRKAKSFFVDPFIEGVESEKKRKIIKADFIRKGGLVRHDPQKLAEALWKFL